jgi:hypothetical protein
VEKPLLEGFVAGFSATLRSAEGDGASDATAAPLIPPPEAPSSSIPPFVLLLINGGDGPVTPAMVRCLGTDGPLGASMRRCYANNLWRCGGGGEGGGRSSGGGGAGGGACSSMDPARFRPLPIGIECAAREAQVLAARAAAPPWEERDARLLLAPMARHGRFRGAYVAALAGREYASLVRIVEERLPAPAFLALLARHRAVLSPPGRGYDCFRTWEALGLGTAPLVVRDEHFDCERLFGGTGVAFMPPPEELTPARLADVLAELRDPAPLAARALSMRRWRAAWAEDVST